MKNLTKAIIFGAASSMALVSAPASAEVFNYTSTGWSDLGGDTLNVTIDTVAQTANFVAGGTNFTVTSPDLANWTNASVRNRPQTLMATAASGVVVQGSFVSASGIKTIQIDNVKPLKFTIGNNLNRFWIGGVDAVTGRRTSTDVYNPYRGYNFSGSTGGSSTSGGTTSGGATSTSTGGISSTSGGGTSGGTTTGGTTTGGTTTGGGSSGGTPVPAPGILGLFGLALAAVGLGRRRRKITA